MKASPAMSPTVAAVRPMPAQVLSPAAAAARRPSGRRPRPSFHPLPRTSSRVRPARQRGAALLTAMVIVTLVATMAATMLWQQWRAVQVESAERGRAQAYWILTGALDWARLILREDVRSGQPVTHLGEPWATPLAEARLSSFLAVDRENTDDAPEAFLSGSMTDMQSRYNLRNLVADGKVVPQELQALRRLCEVAGLAPTLADALAENLRQAWVSAERATPEGAAAAAQAAAAAAQAGGAGQAAAPPLSSNPPLVPQALDDLVWLGVDAASVDRLRPYVVILPEPTRVNVNTAPKEVIAAVIDGLDLSSAERLVQARQRSPMMSPSDAAPLMGRPPLEPLALARVDVDSSYFEVRGRLRFEDRVVEQRFLVKRVGQEVITLHQERSAGVE